MVQTSVQLSIVLIMIIERWSRMTDYKNRNEEKDKTEYKVLEKNARSRGDEGT